MPFSFINIWKNFSPHTITVLFTFFLSNILFLYIIQLLRDPYVKLLLQGGGWRLKVVRVFHWLFFLRSTIAFLMREGDDFKIHARAVKSEKTWQATFDFLVSEEVWDMKSRMNSTLKLRSCMRTRGKFLN